MKPPITLIVLAAVALLYGPRASAQTATADSPQETVECSGWHALCSLADDCTLNSTGANCACWQVNEQHLVATSNIKNETFGGVHVKEQTQTACTKLHPCAVDQAPVCRAIKDLLPSGQWVSDFSYRGWCQKWNPVKCEGARAGLWADCMTSACTENLNPRNPQRPLSCQCTVNNGAFVGTQGTCKSRKGVVMSTIDRLAWDFKKGTFTFSCPGDDYVKESCAPINSDPRPSQR